MNISYLTVPGLAGSGPNHWQTIWEEQFPSSFDRVEQDNWDWPEIDHWVNKLQAFITKGSSPIILVGHSLGCLTIIHWASHFSSDRVIGALLVAPADAELSKRLSFVKGFSPIPDQKLRFPSVVVASTNDRYMTIDRSEYFAELWGSEFINLGRKGHINAVSNLSDWNEGKGILFTLAQKISHQQSLLNH